MNTNEARAKIAKVLRLETSSNSGEAANAAAKVEELCKKYGLTKEDSRDYDPQVDEIVEFSSGKSYVQTDVAVSYLQTCVTTYFNAEVLHYRKRNRGGYIKWTTIVASKGNQIQIELYLEYLIETMNKLADRAKKSGAWGTKSRSYKSNFRKAFALKVAERLQSMKKLEKRVGKPNISEPALVVVNKESKERKAVLDFLNDKYGNLKSKKKVKHSIGYEGLKDGLEAGESVGLNKQTKSSKNDLILTGN
tara:strand:+ start:143 stop:889 length:747 start_codon:yes stop_codon:yes gene_type:complete